MKRAVVLVSILTVLYGACGKPPADPLRLEGNTLTVANQSSSEWRSVEIWLNTYFRATASSIPAGGIYRVPLDTFVAGFGQRFDFHRTQITDLRLTATLPDGKPFELKKKFEVRGLEGAFGGSR